MKIIGISDSYPIHPRLSKIMNKFTGDNELIYICWNRDGREIKECNIISYNKKSTYGKKINKLLNIVKFRKFIIKNIINEDPDYIICRHWQTLFLINSFLRKKYKIIYDVCDMPNNRFIKKIEEKFINDTHKVILASRFFEEFYNKKKSIIMENRPLKKQIEGLSESSSKNDKFIVTFLGKVRYYDVLVNLIEAIKNSDDIVFEVYGNGPDEVRLREYCINENISNINIYGEYKNSDISQIYANSNLVWAAYPYKSLNVKYAISNKFFEVLNFKVIGIFSENTLLGDYINKKNIGITVNPYDILDIRKKIYSIKDNKFQEKFIIKNISEYNQKILWDDYEEIRCD